MNKITGRNSKRNRMQCGDFFEITIISARRDRAFVRLDDQHGDVVSVPVSELPDLAQIPTGLDDFRILDRVTVTRDDGMHIVTGEIHSLAWDRPGCGRGIMIKSDHSTVSTWMPLTRVTVTRAS